MLGTIEELEKEIEEFQNNMLASGEMTKLLQRMIEQMQTQSSMFEKESEAFLTKLTSLPDMIEKENASSNEDIRKKVEAELQNSLDSFSKEQSRYIASLDQIKQQLHDQNEQSERCIKQINEAADRIVTRTEAVPDQIKKDNQEMQHSLVVEIDHTLESRNAQFSEIQGHYVETVKAATDGVESCQSELISKYQDFLRTLEGANIANLHEETQKLKDELNKRTTVLMVLSVIAIAIGAIRLFI